MDITKILLKDKNEECFVEIETSLLYSLVGKEYCNAVNGGSNFKKEDFIFYSDELYESISGFNEFINDYKIFMATKNKIYNPLINRLNVTKMTSSLRFEKDIYDVIKINNIPIINLNIDNDLHIDKDLYNNYIISDSIINNKNYIISFEYNSDISIYIPEVLWIKIILCINELHCIREVLKYIPKDLLVKSMKICYETYSSFISQKNNADSNLSKIIEQSKKNENLLKCIDTNYHDLKKFLICIPCNLKSLVNFKLYGKQIAKQNNWYNLTYLSYFEEIETVMYNNCRISLTFKVIREENKFTIIVNNKKKPVVPNYRLSVCEKSDSNKIILSNFHNSDCKLFFGGKCDHGILTLQNFIKNKIDFPNIYNLENDELMKIYNNIDDYNLLTLNLFTKYKTYCFDNDDIITKINKCNCYSLMDLYSNIIEYNKYEKVKLIDDKIYINLGNVSNICIRDNFFFIN